MKKLTSPLVLISAGTDASDVFYATGFAAVDPVVFVRDGRENILLVPALELGRARESKPGATVFTPEDLRVPRARRKRMSAWLAAFLRERKIHCIRVSSGFPFGLAQRLRRGGITVSLETEAAFPERQIKTAEEVEKMRASQRAAVAAMRRALSILRAARIDRKKFLVDAAGRLSSERLRYEIDIELLRHNCSAVDTIVSCGRDTFNPHSLGHGPLRADRPIVLDIFPQHRATRYWGDLTRTVVRGQASETLHAMHAAVKEAQAEALKRIRPGAMPATVHGEVERVFALRGFETSIRNGVARGFIHSTGHGVGLDIHEAPSIRSAAPGRLRRGNVVTVEPGLYYPETGGVRIEDTVAVTAGGWAYLAPMEERLEI